MSNSSRTEPQKPFTMTITPLTTKVLSPDGTLLSVCAVTAQAPHDKDKFHTILLEATNLKNSLAKIQNYNQFYARKGLGTVTTNDKNKSQFHSDHIEVQRMDNFSGNCKYVGSALHEFAFRFSVEKGKQGHVELTTTGASPIFHYACSFRVASFYEADKNHYLLEEEKNQILADLIASKERVYGSAVGSVCMFLPDEQIQEKLKLYTPVKSEIFVPGEAKPTPVMPEEKKQVNKDIIINPLIMLDWSLVNDVIKSCRTNAEQYLKQYPVSEINLGILFGKKSHRCQQQANELIAICDQFDSLKNDKDMKQTFLFYFIAKELIDLIYKHIPTNDELFVKLNTDDPQAVMMNNSISSVMLRPTFCSNVIKDFKTCLDAAINRNYGHLGVKEDFSLSIGKLPSAHSLKDKDLPKLLVNLKNILSLTPEDEMKISALSVKEFRIK